MICFCFFISLSILHCPSHTSCCIITIICSIFLQKPGGIIALLDEAWYAASILLYLIHFFWSFLGNLSHYSCLCIWCSTYLMKKKLHSVSVTFLYYIVAFGWFHVYLTASCSMFPKSTHETFAQKLFQTYKNNKRFIKPKLSRTSFTISHYAGEVTCFALYIYKVSLTMRITQLYVFCPLPR